MILMMMEDCREEGPAKMLFLGWGQIALYFPAITHLRY